jgi:urease gamma subunit
MKLTQHERDRLLVYVAAELARRRLGDGVRLGHPETVALIADEMHRAARAGQDLDSVLNAGRKAVDEANVLDGVPEMIEMVQVEATFPEGTKLVTLTDPFE